MAEAAPCGMASKPKISPGKIERFCKLVSGHEKLLAAIGRL